MGLLREVLFLFFLSFCRFFFCACFFLSSEISIKKKAEMGGAVRVTRKIGEEAC